MEPGPTAQRGFIPYPTNRVVGTIADPDDAHAAVSELLRTGVDREDIDVLRGEADIVRLDPTGEQHGVLAQVQRSLIRNAATNEEYRHLQRHVDDLRAGRFVIMVLVRQREQRSVVADVLNAHGAEFVGFYGRWAWEGFPSDAEMSSGAAETGQSAPQRETTSPEQILSLLIDAWNARDPDALAALFEQDAELITAGGSWCHDRTSIRDAFADQFARLDRGTTLSLDESRVKWVRPDIAVVFARMLRLAGGSSDRAGQPESLTTTCSFVVRRVGDGWTCAAAHTAEVTPKG